jgi:hypothetical protein
MTPVEEQEAKKGHRMMWLGGDVYLEVSAYRGKTYAAVRRWFKADDGQWYRTKNGLHMLAEELKKLMEYLSEDGITVAAFMAEEVKSPWEDQS